MTVFQIRPNEQELKEMGPEFNELWNTYFKDKPDKPVMFGSIVAGGGCEVATRFALTDKSWLLAYADHTLLPPGKYITM